MKVDKAEIVAILRARGLHARADWVDRALPDIIDVYDNHSLLSSTLDIDPATLHPAGEDWLTEQDRRPAAPCPTR